MTNNFETLEDFIAFLKKNTPEAINQHLLEISGDGAPLYPKELVKEFFIPIKENYPELDEKLFAAAELSKDARKKAIAEGKFESTYDTEGKLNRQGSFFYSFFIANNNNPLESKIMVLHRKPKIGKGLGAVGGLIESSDRTIDPEREIREELGELCETEEEKLTLKKIIDKIKRQRVFSCQDDAHVINRGWGFRVKAHAFVGSPIDLNQDDIKFLQTLPSRNPKNTEESEVAKAELIMIKDIPARTAEFFYGHEGFLPPLMLVAMREAGIKITEANDPMNLYNEEQLGIIARKMDTTVEVLRATYQAVKEQDIAHFTPVDIQKIADSLKTRVENPVIDGGYPLKGQSVEPIR